MKLFPMKHKTFNLHKYTNLAKAGLAIAFCFSLAIISSCNPISQIPNPPPPPIEEQPDYEMTVLVYAIASNNLSEDLDDDMDEMLSGLKYVDLNCYNWLVYYIKSASDISLVKVERGADGNPTYAKIQSYENNILSTDPRRIAEVINYVFTTYDARRKGLVFWSHGSSWSYEPTAHSASDTSFDSPVCYAYGGDNSTDTTDWTNIDELASAVPDGILDFIWFDNCYMSSIEVMYQFRNKAKTFIGYPTEIYSPGAPYDETVPLIMQSQPDYKEAAMATYAYYNDDNYAVTICVADLEKIEPLAEQCRKANINFKRVNTTGLQKYSRGRLGPYFDLGQYTRTVGNNEGSQYDEDAFNKALNDFVIYKAASNRNFNGLLINKDNFSGISTHAYEAYPAENDEYYRSLDWYKRIMQ